jgi:starch synthase
MDPDRPAVTFVGRITRQKGLPYLMRAAARLPEDVQVVLCAGAPDTPEIKAEVEGLLADLRAQRDGVVWIPEMLPRSEVISLLTASTVFACPSVYEPLGIVNLEAMACELPVVATATGGIPEVVVPGETGWLVPIEQVQDGTGTPVDPEKFVGDLAEALTNAVSDRERARTMGLAGRKRAVEQFSWESIGDKTMAVYQDVLGRS